MATPVLQPVKSTAAPRWNPVLRIAFRFCLVYFGLFALTTQIVTAMFPLPGVDPPDPATLWPIRQLVFWVAAHVFQARLPLVYTGSGSGDKVFDWVLTFCLLTVGATATAIWSVLDRKRDNYTTLSKWFRLALRFALAGQMLAYGMAKFIPLQMPYPPLTRLLEPFHDFSPMGVLWASIGSSPAYEIFAGSAELLGGILLIFPRTAMLGALVCLADMIQVFMLNMTYDVPVKILSFHLALFSLFLLAPELRRLAAFFFSNRAVGPSTQPPLFETRRANRLATRAQVAFGLWLLAMNVYGSWTVWPLYGGGGPKPPLYGIWNVDELSLDGHLRPPLLTDYGRWRRLVFDVNNVAAFQRIDDSFARYVASVDTTNRKITLTRGGDKNWKASFNFERPVHDRLIVDGKIDGYTVQMKLRLVDRSKFLLVSRGFHWVQDLPFNR